MAAATGLEVRLHGESVDVLLDEWERLFAADPEASPFVSPQWAAAWWPHWAGAARPWIVAVRDSGSLIGLAPLVLGRRGPFRVVSVLGRDPGNYWDVIALPDRRQEAVEAIAREIVERRRDWDALALGGLPIRSGIAAALDRVPQLRVRRRDPVPHPGIELPSTFEEYLDALPGKRRKDLRRHLRRLDDGELECRSISEPAELDEAVLAWQELRQRWWSARGKALKPTHASTRFREFVRDLMGRLVPAGLGLVWEFRHAGRVVGIEISLVDERCFYAWLDGYDPDAAQLGLGKVAAAEGIRSSIGAGRERFDFMVGAEPYKYWFGATDSYREWLLVTHGAWRSRGARTAGELAGRFAKDGGR